MAALRHELESERALRLKSEAKLAEAIRADGRQSQEPTEPALRRRGRPPKAAQAEPQAVEWWVPGWDTKFQ